MCSGQMKTEAFENGAASISVYGRFSADDRRKSLKKYPSVWTGESKTKALYSVGENILLRFLRNQNGDFSECISIVGAKFLCTFSIS